MGGLRDEEAPGPHEYVALNKKRCKHQRYKRNGGGMDIAEWEGAGMPTRPLPPPPPL